MKIKTNKKPQRSVRQSRLQNTQPKQPVLSNAGFNTALHGNDYYTRTNPANNNSQPSQSGAKQTPPKKEGRTVIDLSIPGKSIAGYITRTAHHKIEPTDIMLLYISDTADFIAYCRQQFNYYSAKRFKLDNGQVVARPDLTPLYLFVGYDKSVIKMANTLGDINDVVKYYREQGYNFQLVKDQLLKH